MAASNSSVLKSISISFDAEDKATTKVEVQLLDTPVTRSKHSSIAKYSDESPSPESRNDRELMTQPSSSKRSSRLAQIFRSGKLSSSGASTVSGGGNSSFSSEDDNYSDIVRKNCYNSYATSQAVIPRPPMTSTFQERKEVASDHTKDEGLYLCSTLLENRTVMSKRDDSSTNATTSQAVTIPRPPMTASFQQRKKEAASDNTKDEGLYLSSSVLESRAIMSKRDDASTSSVSSSLLEKKVSLLSRADKIILMTRNSYAASPPGSICMSDSASNRIDASGKAIIRTRSLDRSLTTREVLENASLVLGRDRHGKLGETRSDRGIQEIKSAFRLKEQSEENDGAPVVTHDSVQINIYERQSPAFDRSHCKDMTNPDEGDKVASPSQTKHEVNICDKLSQQVGSDKAYTQGEGSSPYHAATSICSKDELLPRVTIGRSLSPTESSVATIEEHDESMKSLPSFLSKVPMVARDKVLQRLDGIGSTPSREQQKPKQEGRSKDLASTFMNLLWGGSEEDGETHSRATPVAPLMACGPGRVTRDEDEDEAYPYEQKFTAMANAIIRRKHVRVPSYSETVLSSIKVDHRMQDWIDGQFALKESPPNDGSYQLGRSRTVIVHEIVRGDWTWCTAWSPDGTKLAVGTENHHLAIVDIESAVWRVKHDSRISGPERIDTTHSIRSIAWGSSFIAIGGTGNAVSILSPKEPYHILHTIKGTGFVGSLDWKSNSSVLAIGSRNNTVMIVAMVQPKGEASSRQIESEILHISGRDGWVNAVAFSPGGTVFAVGDAVGILSVYRYDERPDTPVNVTLIKSFTFEDSILNMSFSSDGKWLYAGGEDFRVTMIDTNYWDIVHRIKRNRWVQCISSSRGGTHVAVGGVSSEVSLLEVAMGWDTVINIELKGLVPLSASWHPRDQYLALTGQNNSILVVETTNARHIKGHFLRSISPILAVEFSPDGRMAVIGNQQGVVTFYNLKGSTFFTAYEIVVSIGKSLSIRWSSNGKFIVIGALDSIIVVGRMKASEIGTNLPPNASGFSIRRVIRGLGEVNSVSIDNRNQYIAASGTQTRFFDATSDFVCTHSIKTPSLEANGWSPDRRFFATIGENKTLTVYDTDYELCDRWRVVFSLQGTHAGLALAWGPVIVNGLLYLAYGGEDKTITIVQIRSEGTWETVLRASRDDVIYDLDWNKDGLLAVAVGNGTVSIVDLSYLQSGLAVNEMDYNWQRQALTCFTEIRRNRGRNSMRTVRWIPAVPGSYNLLAIGGSDGELEIVDLSERDRCRGFNSA